MNNVSDKKIRKTLLSIIFTMTLAVASVFFVSNIIADEYQAKENDIHANLIGYISETYDIDENEIISILLDDNGNYTEEGYKILEKYGLNQHSENITAIRNRMITVFSIVIVIFVIIVFIIVYFYLLKLDSSIGNISKYIDRLLHKDYALDIIDNDEGNLSALKNDIYKITVMLKEQNEELKKDKMHLANNLADISHQL